MKAKMKSPIWYSGLELTGLILFPCLFLYSLVSQFEYWQALSYWKLFFYSLSVWLFADFLSGVVHWAADTYGNENTPIFGKGLIQPFREHHVEPFKMTTHTYLFTNGSLYFGSSILVGASLFIAVPDLKFILLLLAFWVAHTNQIHKWSHQKQEQRSIIAKTLSFLGIIISPSRHRGHHIGDFDSSYCITSGMCNPFLNSINFWRRMERLISKVLP